MNAFIKFYFILFFVSSHFDHQGQAEARQRVGNDVTAALLPRHHLSGLEQPAGKVWPCGESFKSTDLLRQQEASRLRRRTENGS